MSLKLRQRINGRVLSPLGLRLVRVRPLSRQVAVAEATLSDVLIEEVDDLRFRTTDWVYSTPVSHLVGRPIFGYGPQSWHPFVAASGELLEDIDTPYESSVLKQFYDSFTPQSIADACRLDDAGPLADIPAVSLFEPWRLALPPLDDPYAKSRASGSPLFGPLPRSAGEAEWRRLRGCVMSIRQYGYRPELFPRGLIRVTVLRSRGEQRYLVGHGQHRAAVLAAMNHERIDVGLHTNDPLVVDEAEVHLWPHVRSGFLSEDRAVAMLRRYFTTPASDRALEIGAAAQGDIRPAARLGR